MHSCCTTHTVFHGSKAVNQRHVHSCMYILCHRCLLVAGSTTEPAGGSCMSCSAAAQHAALSRGSCLSSSIFCPAYFSERSDPKVSYLSHSASQCFLLIVWQAPCCCANLVNASHDQHAIIIMIASLSMVTENVLCIDQPAHVNKHEHE